MSVVNEKDFLYLIWHDRKTKKQYIVGTLTKNGKYEFEYSNEIEEAMENGFNLLIAFPDKSKKYENDMLFPAFATRLPDEKRVDIDTILEKYKMKKYDAYELLKRSGAKLPIDDLEFIDPIPDIEREVKRDFFVAGSRHYLNCEGGIKCQKQSIEIGSKIELECEPDNVKDEYAVKMLYNGKLIGYVPRYYARSIFNILSNKRSYTCKVIEVNENNDCRNCIKVNFYAK